MKPATSSSTTMAAMTKPMARRYPAPSRC